MASAAPSDRVDGIIVDLAEAGITSDRWSVGRRKRGICSIDRTLWRVGRWLVAGSDPAASALLSSLTGRLDT
jgi:hypothetical protein